MKIGYSDACPSCGTPLATLRRLLGSEREQDRLSGTILAHLCAECEAWARRQGYDVQPLAMMMIAGKS